MPSTLSIVNNLETIQLSASGSLPSAHYTLQATSLPANGISTQVLQFDRSSGITSGQSFSLFLTFALTAELSTLQCSVNIALVGTTLDSSMTVTATIGADTTPALTDTGTETATGTLTTVGGSALAEVLTLKRVGTAGHDDLVLEINPGAQKLAADNLVLPAYNTLDMLDLVDVGGEGRIHADGNVTGFRQAYNLNAASQNISNGPNTGQPIPNKITVSSWATPTFPLADNSVLYMTMMGVPIEANVVTEMLRVLDPSNGVVFLYDPGTLGLATFIETIAASNSKIVAKPNDPLNAPFDEPSFKPVHIFGMPGKIDHDEL